MDAAAVRGDLLAWYDASARVLPWRVPPGAGKRKGVAHPAGATGTCDAVAVAPRSVAAAPSRDAAAPATDPAPPRAPDPYAVFVSEVMLQQTRVETVLRHYDAWMRRFPDWRRLAAASEEEVMAQWAGLGYYRRARNLHAAARHVVADGLPQDARGLRALPGVGPYMAGAVASIAFGERVPAVDGNVVRVISRLADIGERADRAPGRRRIEAEAVRLVDPQRPGDWNQALMDLGAAVCTPRPDCPRCPLTAHCAARRAGTQASRPVIAARATPREEPMHFALVEHEGRVLVVRRPEGGLLAGTWMLPGGNRDRGLEEWVRQQAGLAVDVGTARRVRHAFTHRVWDMHVHKAWLLEGRGRDMPGETDGAARGLPATANGTPRVHESVAADHVSGGAVGVRAAAGHAGEVIVGVRAPAGDAHEATVGVRAAPGDVSGATGPESGVRWVDPLAPDVALSTACRNAMQAHMA